MYGQICITLADGSCLTADTCAFGTIYDWMIARGFSHALASDLAGWADLAGTGECYDLSDDGSEDSFAEIWNGGQDEPSLLW